MSQREPLEADFRRLAEYVDVRPDFASSVMRELEGQVAERRWATFPDRARRWIMKPMLPYAAGASAVAVLILAAVVWVKPTDLGASVAFAEVQEALRQVDTVYYDMDFPDSPHRNMRVLFTRDIDGGRLRMEWPTGVAFVVDLAEGETLVLNGKDKSAQRMRGPAPDFTAGEILDKLATVEQEAIKRLGERAFEGRTLVGFLVEREDGIAGEMETRVWVDPKTRLPVRMETVPLNPDDPRAAPFHMIGKFTFNEPLDEALFSLKPPEGYTVVEGESMEAFVEVMPVPPAPTDKRLVSPVIEPRVGIGRARFGMTLEEVVEALGKPDGVTEHWEPPAELWEALSDVEKKAREDGMDDAERRRLRDDVLKKYDVELEEDPGGRTGRILPRGEPNGLSVGYEGRGFRLTILNGRGLCRIECTTGEPGTRDFSGRTGKGIGMGASREEIEKAYGPPDRELRDADGAVRLSYELLGTSFSLRDGRLGEMSFSRK